MGLELYLPLQFHVPEEIFGLNTRWRTRVSLIALGTRQTRWIVRERRKTDEKKDEEEEYNTANMMYTRVVSHGRRFTCLSGENDA